MQRKGNTALSIEDIRGHYFKKSATTEPEIKTEKFKEGSELTTSALYILKQAKKRIGQEALATESKTKFFKEEELFELSKHVEDTEGETLSEKERTAVVAALNASFEHYDLLSPLVSNPDVNDIIISAYDDISIQKGRRNVKTDLRFADQETYKSFIENLLKRVGKSCTTATPVVDAALDSNIRACVTHESFSPAGMGPMLTLRIARHKNTTIDHLVQNELAPREILEYLSVLIRDAQATVLVAGEVGTGKTTLVKALANEIEEDEALLIIEDTHELVLHRNFVRTLLTREANTEGSGRISPAQAIRTGMRLAMNRIILGEMRDAEAAEAFIDVCASGHSGISTIHAKSARDAISRLELFLSRAQAGVGIQTIRREIADALSIIIYLGVDKETNKRRIMQIIELGASSDGAIQVSPIFSYVTGQGIPLWRSESGVTKFQTALSKGGITMPATGTTFSLDAESMYRMFNNN